MKTGDEGPKHLQCKDSNSFVIILLFSVAVAKNFSFKTRLFHTLGAYDTQLMGPCPSILRISVLSFFKYVVDAGAVKYQITIQSSHPTASSVVTTGLYNSIQIMIQKSSAV